MLVLPLDGPNIFSNAAGPAAVNIYDTLGTMFLVCNVSSPMFCGSVGMRFDLALHPVNGTVMLAYDILVSTGAS